jgi:PmbA protein
MQKTKGLVKRLLALGLSVTTIATSISTGYVPTYAKAATVTQEETKTDSTDATNEKEPKVATISFSEDALLQKAVDNAGFTIDVTTGKVKAAAIRYNDRLLSIGVDYTAKAVKTAQQEASDRTTYTYDVIIEGQGAYSGAYTRHGVTQVQKKEVAATSKTATTSDAAKGTVKRVANKKGVTYTAEDWHITWNDSLPKNPQGQPIFIYKGSEKYHKVNTYNKDLEKVSIDEKMKNLYALEKALKGIDKRIVEVAGTEYSESTEKHTLVNSNGLNLVQKANYFKFVGQCVAKEGEQTKSGYDFFLGNKFEEFNPEEFAKKIVKLTVDQLGGEACESNKYKAVLHPDVVTSLMRAYIGHANAEEVQKNSSLFIGKIGQKIASNKVTIEDKPLQKNVFARWFDDEGVATYNKPIIKNGRLETYLYNLTTAAKAGVQTTGNGYGGGSKRGIASSFLSLKPGKKSLEQLFEEVGNGVYITDVSGLHAGLNPQSGNFSLQSTGFMIENGKKGKPLDLITVSGNLLEIFKDVLEVGNDVTVSPSGVSAESLLIKKIAVSGK